jgi:hypothetical protein
MHLPPLRLFAACIAAAAGLLCWYLLNRKPDAAPPASRTVPASASPGTDNSVVPAPSPLPEYGSHLFQSVMHERGLVWLNSRGRDAAGLIALWDITYDEELLREAAEKFPTDPGVCRAMIQESRGHAQTEQLWIERLLAAQPGNPDNLYLKCASLLSGDDRAGALAVLRDAVLVKTPRLTDLRSRALAIRDAALAAGAAPAAASRIALQASAVHSGSVEMAQGISRVLSEEIHDARVAGDEARLLYIAGLALAFADRLPHASPPLLSDTTIASDLRTTVLASLSDDTEIGERGGVTVAQLKQDAQKWEDDLRNIYTLGTRAEEFLTTASDAVVAEYTERFLTDGEVSAWQWAAERAAERK